jgi:hypothetical protein
VLLLGIFKRFESVLIVFSAFILLYYKTLLKAVKIGFFYGVNIDNYCQPKKVDTMLSTKKG